MLAGAYRGHGRGQCPPADAQRTHVVELDVAGLEVRVLCSRVALASLADLGADDPAAPATCPICARRDPRPR